MRKARMDAGLTLRDLAAISGVGHVTISHIENGSRDGRMDTIELLADALGLSIDEYIGHEVRRIDDAPWRNISCEFGD